MAIQDYSTVAGRINKLKGEILKSAMPVEVLGITGVQKQMPKNKGDNVVFRRWNQFGGDENNFLTAATADAGDQFATDHVTTEGVTPTADSLTATDYTATLIEYSALYGLTNKSADLYEDDLPPEMKRQVGKRIGLVREMVRYGSLKANANPFYSGGSSRLTVDEALTLNLMRKVARALESNHAETITQILAPSPNFATKAIEASYLVFCHTDCESDVRDMAGFIAVADYGQRKPVHEREIGSVENFRIITSPELVPILDGGAAVGTTGLESTGTKVDIYPVIVTGEDAWGQVALRGRDSIEPTYIPPGQKDTSDPLGQRGYIGCNTYFTAIALNDGWYATVECGATAL